VVATVIQARGLLPTSEARASCELQEHNESIQRESIRRIEALQVKIDFDRFPAVDPR
jgi:hypothetical protein